MISAFLGASSRRVAFDKATDVVSNTTTFSHVCNGTNRILLVACVTADDDTDRISDITYNGVAMTRAATVAYVGSYRSYLYLLVNPAAGANNVIITETSAFIYASSMSYSGAKQSAQPDASGTNSGLSASLTVSLTTVVENCVLVGMFFSGNTNTRPTAPAQLRNTPATNSIILADGGYPRPIGATSIVAGQAGAELMTGIVVSIAPA